MISLRGLLSTKESCEAGTIKTIKTFLTWNEDVTISYAPCQQTRREITTEIWLLSASCVHAGILENACASPS